MNVIHLVLASYVGQFKCCNYGSFFLST